VESSLESCPVIPGKGVKAWETLVKEGKTKSLKKTTDVLARFHLVTLGKIYYSQKCKDQCIF
jgi:hypothetical protein